MVTFSLYTLAGEEHSVSLREKLFENKTTSPDNGRSPRPIRRVSG